LIEVKFKLCLANGGKHHLVSYVTKLLQLVLDSHLSSKDSPVMTQVGKPICSAQTERLARHIVSDNAPAVHTVR
jgi:hypothetical protein